MLSLIGPHKILFTDSVQRELSKYCRKSECVHCGNVRLINALLRSYEVQEEALITVLKPLESKAAI